MRRGFLLGKSTERHQSRNQDTIARLAPHSLDTTTERRDLQDDRNAVAVAELRPLPPFLGVKQEGSTYERGRTTGALTKFPVKANRPPTPEARTELDVFDEFTSLEIDAVVSPPVNAAPLHEITVLHLWKGMREALFERIPDFPHPFSTPTPPIHRIAPVPGAGMGFFLTADVQAGDTILRERPLLINPRAMPMTTQTRGIEDMYALYERAFTHLHPANAHAFLGLHNCHADETPSTVAGIVYTNSLRLPQLPGFAGPYSAVARDISRANHSCCPNATVRWDLATCTLALRATRPIRAGEQAHIAYTDTLDARPTRVQELERKYKFRCACVACARTGAAHGAGETRRMLLRQRPHLDDAFFARWLAAGAPALPEPLSRELAQAARWEREGHAFAVAMFTWNMMEAEGYVCGTVWGPVVETLCKAYAVLEDGRKVKQWATVAARLSVAYYGEDGRWGAVAETPEHNEWWGRRSGI